MLKFTMISWLRDCLLGFFPFFIFSYSHLPMYSLEGSHSAQPTLKNGKLCSVFLRTEYLVIVLRFFYVESLSILHHIYIYIYLQRLRYLFFASCFNWMLSFLMLIILSAFSMWGHFQLAPVSHLYASINVFFEGRVRFFLILSQDAPGSFCIFPAYSMIQSFLHGTLVSFFRESY